MYIKIHKHKYIYTMLRTPLGVLETSYNEIHFQPLEVALEHQRLNPTQICLLNTIGEKHI